MKNDKRTTLTPAQLARYRWILSPEYSPESPEGFEDDKLFLKMCERIIKRGKNTR